MRRPVSVTFLPAAVTVEVATGDTILDAALDNGIHIEHECGGNCTCTTCHVFIQSGFEHVSPVEEPESYRLQFADDRSPQSRLACQALLLGGPVVVVIP